MPKIKLPAKLLLILGIIGPGLITAFGDNDAGGIATNSMVGARFGYSFLWILLIVTIQLTIILESCARLGVVSGKGLMDLIRENFGVKWSLLVMAALYAANLACITANFAGVAASGELAGLPKFLTIPVASVIAWILLTRGSYRSVEKFLICLSLLMLSYIGAAFLAKPDWGMALKQSVVPSIELNREYLYLVIATVGTTIAPWMIFFIQSAIVDKGINRKELIWTKLEIWISSFVTDYGISFFIIVACAAVLHPAGIEITDAKDAAIALTPLAGGYSSLLFGLGLFASSSLAIFLLPLTTAYVTCEAFGFEQGLNRKVSEAPIFYGIVACFLLIGITVTLLPGIVLFRLIIAAQVIAGLVLPIILIFILMLVNDRGIMGEHVNSRAYNVVSWGVVGGVVATALVYTVLMIAGRVT